MSFIYQDNNLLDQLTHIGVKYLEKFGQPAGAQYDLETYQFADKLLDDLQKQVDPASIKSTTVSPLKSQTGKDVDITSNELRDLGDFLNWAAENKLTWDNKRFAWTADEITKNPSLLESAGKVGKFTSYTPTRIRQLEDRQPTTQTPFAAKKELLSVISFLRESKENKENEVFQTMLANLISQVNADLKDAEQIKIRPDTTTPTLNLDPNMIIDVLPIVLSETEPFNNIQWRTWESAQGRRITPTILNDDTLFRKFILDQMFQPKSGNTITNTRRISELKNPCPAIHAFYLRAQHLVNQVHTTLDTKTPGYSKALQLYKDKIIEVGKTFYTADNKSCSVVNSDSIVITDNKKDSDTLVDDNNTDKRNKDKNKEAFYKLISASSLPLKNGLIDLDKIENFATAYVEFERTSRNMPSARTSFTQITKLVSAIRNQIRNRTSVINLNQNAYDMSTMLDEGYINMQRFLSALRQLVNTVSTVLTQIQSTYGDYLTEEADELLNRQINDYRRNNTAAISGWDSALQMALQYKRS
jgi:hypothetical protein